MMLNSNSDENTVIALCKNLYVLHKYWQNMLGQFQFDTNYRHITGNSIFGYMLCSLYYYFFFFRIWRTGAI